MCRQAASTLRNKVRMSNSVLVGSLNKSIDTVVDILLNGIVYGAFAAWRACSVIVNTESSTTVNEVNIVAHLVKLHIELCRFAQSSLNAAYLGYLTSNMEMNQSQRVVKSFAVENLKSLKQFARSKTELRGIAAAFFPFAAARRSKFYPYSEIRLHVEFLCSTRNDVELVKFLNDNEDALAHLLSQQCKFYITLVFISVADDERVALALHSDDGMQFRLRTSFQTEIELAPMRNNLLNDRLHLVYFNRIDDEVFCLVVVFLSSLLKARSRFLDTTVENVRKPEQHWWRNIAQRQFVHNFAKVYSRLSFTRCNNDISFAVNIKIGHPPTIEVVQFF